MKTAAAFKVQVAVRALKDGKKPVLQLRGDATLYTVASIRNRGFALELTLDRRAGVIIIDPDDILMVKVISMPTLNDD